MVCRKPCCRRPEEARQQTGIFFVTEVTLFPGLKFLTLGQNYHHIHRLYPRVSWYHYQRVFNLIRPALVKNNAPIEVLFSQETGKMVSSDDVKQLHLMGIASLDLYINQIRFEDSSLCNVTDDKVNEERRWALDWPTQGV